jgi:serine/threonine-protein kinase
MLGTPGFMAPEQILGMQLDGRADLYALGCCAWWLLTGREVFAREPAEAKILHKHIYEPVPRLRDHLPDHVSGHVSSQTHDQVSDPLTSWCPPALEAVIAACLAKDIAERPRDARDLAAMLRAIEIPPDVAWTPERAGDWWRAYQPVAAPSAPLAGEVQVIMPGRTDQRPVAATSETAIAQTIASSQLPG